MGKVLWALLATVSFSAVAAPIVVAQPDEVFQVIGTAKVQMSPGGTYQKLGTGQYACVPGPCSIKKTATNYAKLAWNRNIEAAGTFVYMRTPTDLYFPFVFDSRQQSGYSLLGLSSGVTYYFVATSYTATEESVATGEVSKAIP